MGGGVLFQQEAPHVIVEKIPVPLVNPLFHPVLGKSGIRRAFPKFVIKQGHHLGEVHCVIILSVVFNWNFHKEKKG